MLARAGLDVVVHEAAERIGGGARTDELTLPGFRHDVCSAIHPLARPSPAFRGLDIEWIHSPAVLAALRSGRLGGAALDVLPQEPPPVPPVASNLILTPHAAYYSAAAEERAYRLCLARVREVLGFA